MKLKHHIKESSETYVFEENNEFYFYVEKYDENGWIETREVWHNNNNNPISLTPKGQEVIEKVQKLNA